MFDNSFSLFLSYLDKGGIVFIILLFFSFVSLSIIIFKLIQFYLLRSLNLTEIEKVIKSSENINNLETVSQILEEKNNLFSRIVSQSIEIFNDTNLKENEKISEISFITTKEVKPLEKLLPSLDIIAQVSPLLGLLGTVIGMISSFNQLELGGSNIDPSILAGGIWTALLTTAIGLIVAIPALIAHHFFEKKIETIQEGINGILVLINNYKK